MKQVYLMFLSYQSIKAAQKELREVSSEIKAASSNDFTIAMRAEQSMLIAFTSEISQADLTLRMKGLGYGEIRYALFETDRLLAGFLDAHVLDWMAARLPRQDSRRS